MLERGLDRLDARVSAHPTPGIVDTVEHAERHQRQDRLGDRWLGVDLGGAERTGDRCATHGLVLREVIGGQETAGRADGGLDRLRHGAAVEGARSVGGDVAQRADEAGLADDRADLDRVGRDVPFAGAARETCAMARDGSEESMSGREPV